MKRLLTAAAALSLMASPALSLAQEHRDEHPEGGHPPSAGAPHAPTSGAPHGPPAGAPGGAPGGYHPQTGAPTGGRAVAGAPTYRGASGGLPPGYHGPAAPPPGAHGPRPGGAAFAVGGRTFYRYRAPPYAFPPAYAGWSNHYWRRGEFLPSVFFLPNYFIDDYWSYGLWAPDYGYQWIRVGGDALLINLATGQVVDVVPGVYYW